MLHREGARSIGVRCLVVALGTCIAAACAVVERHVTPHEGLVEAGAGAASVGGATGHTDTGGRPSGEGGTSGGREAGGAGSPGSGGTLDASVVDTPDAPIDGPGTPTDAADAAPVPVGCENDKKDGTETDVDCGSECGATCTHGLMCARDSDCTSGWCVSGRCESIREVSAGAGHTCVVSRSGKLYCWGLNDDGQFGDGTTIGSVAPRRIGVDTGWESVSACRGFTCGIRAGMLFCWGQNETGQLGDGTIQPRRTPGRVGEGARWQHVVTGVLNITCGIESGALYCWGRNERGAVGDGTIMDRRVPVRIGAETDWSKVSASLWHTCGIRAGKLYCWGANPLGELGDGAPSDTPRLLPGQVGTASDWEDIEVGAATLAAGHTCGIRARTLYCWGGNPLGQLGDGTNTNSATPIRIGTTSNWTAIGGNGDHSCGIRGNSLYCWGLNDKGQLGDGTATDKNAPVLIPPSLRWELISGMTHTCGMRNDRLYCWGPNDKGQLGDGTQTERHAPVPVVSP